MARRKRLSPDPFELEVGALLENGRGTAVHEGKALEVHGCLPGERVLARHLFGRRLRGQAETLAVLRASPDRVEPRCPHFGTCSACTLQHMEPGAQAEFKQGVLLNHLDRAGIRPEALLPALRADSWHYRRKARLSVRYVKGKGRVLVGFRERDGRFVTDMAECHVVPGPVAERIQELAELVGSLAAFDAIPQIEVSCGDHGAALVFRHLVPLGESDRGQLREFARATGLAVLLQGGGADSVRTLEPEALQLGYALPEYGLEHRFGPLDFVQVNGPLNSLMVDRALALLAPGPDERVLDLFCGLGNFTLPLATRAGHVTGVEGDAQLVQRAVHNARRNGISNADFLHADLYTDGGVRTWSGQAFDKVLLDPPRSGAERALPGIAATGAARVAYVSCDPATLARDAAILSNRHGFGLKAAGVMDMFPHTTHVESVALLQR
jgi:23S rRNA (uracil1939-C5)-methyltransferase